ncbi:aldo/keto reductase [Micromonospora chalcea]
MKYRALGRTEIQVSDVGIGTWEMSGDVWGAKDDSTSKAAIAAGIEAGANFIDTAAGYGAGHVEELIGEFLHSSSISRSDVVISTKVKPKNGRFAPPPNVPVSEAYAPDWIVRQVEESLRRLRTDYVDVLFMHTWSRGWDADEEWYATVDKLKQAGKIRAIGISVPDEGPAEANTHIEAGRVDVVQVVYNVFQQEPEYALFPLAKKHDIGIVARSPFSSGALVQDWRPDMQFEDGDWRGSWPLEVKPGWLEDQTRMAGLVKEIFGAAGIDQSLGALTYVLANDVVSSVIPGSANPDHVRGNVAAAMAPRLDDGLIENLKDLWRNGLVHGTYNGSV